MKLVKNKMKYYNEFVSEINEVLQSESEMKNEMKL